MRYALVTGASSGIGQAFARRLAQHGYQLVVVGRDPDALGATPAAETLVADLTAAGDVDRVTARLSATDRAIDVFVHAAARTTAAPFGTAPLTDDLAQIDLNVRATAILLHHAWRAMSARRSGSIIAVGSTAAVWSTGSYAASKAWLANLMNDLANRSDATGVRCLLVSPGFTRTDLHRRAGIDARGVPGWMWLDPDVVATEALRAVHAGRQVCIPTRRYRALVFVARLLPVRTRKAALRRLAPLRAEAAQ